MRWNVESNMKHLGLHHIYTDSTDFEYKVVLTRVLVHGKNKNQKYTVYLFASNAQPSTYMAGAKLTTAFQKSSYLRDECRRKFFLLFPPAPLPF